MTCAPWYESNRVNRVRYGVINPGIDRIMIKRAYLDNTASGVDEAINGSRRYETERVG
jgi:hypothetical protein